MNKRDIASVLVAISLLTACGNEANNLDNSEKQAQESKKNNYQYKTIDSLTQLKRVDTPEAFQVNQKGKVTEYFSFTCIHCFNVSPLINESNSRLKDHITKKHLVRNGESVDNHRFKMNETLIKFGRDDLINEAFKKTMQGKLSSEKDIVKFISDEDTEGEMIGFYNSEELSHTLKEEIEVQNKIIIPGTPYFVIDGTHTIDTGKAKTWEVAIKTIEKATEMNSIKN